MPTEWGGRIHMGTLKETWPYDRRGNTETGRFPVNIKMWPLLQVSSGYLDGVSSSEDHPLPHFPIQSTAGAFILTGPYQGS